MRFKALRAKNKAQAFRQLNDDLMVTVSVLVPAVMTFDNFMDNIRKNEDYLKGDTTSAGISPAETLRNFLQTGKVS